MTNKLRAYPKVSIIILNYNGVSDTLECLASLSKSAYKNTEIILVDNGSTDGSVRKITGSFPQVKIIKNSRNVGYAEGNNIGYRKATGDLILFLNNDTIVGKNFLTPLVKRLYTEPDIGAVQPKIMNYPRLKIIDSIGSYFLTTGFLYHYGHNKKDKKQYNKPAEIFSMKGACMLFKKSVLEKVGTFDHTYFAYFEETDLCQRVLLAGYRIVYTPESMVLHKGGMTSGKMNNAFINYHSYKNRIYTYLKNLEIATIIRVLPVHILYCCIVTLLYVLTLQFGMAIAVQKAILWNILHTKQIMRERRQIKKIRILHDGSYLTKLTRSVRPSYYVHLFTTALAGYKDT